MPNFLIRNFSDVFVFYNPSKQGQTCEESTDQNVIQHRSWQNVILWKNIQISASQKNVLNINEAD